MQSYLGSIKAQIEVDDPGAPPPQRENDVPFMDAIVNNPNFSTAEKKYANQIRMFHNFFWGSDIAKANGHHIDQSMLTGSPSLMSSSHNGENLSPRMPNCSCSMGGLPQKPATCMLFPTAFSEILRANGCILLSS
jgi:hypothetical protein